MILVDANILLYAIDALSPRHIVARDWWDEQLSGSSPVGLCWPVLSAFVRIATNARVYAKPLSAADATSRIDSWLKQPCTRLVVPTEAHWGIFRKLLEQAGAAGNLVSDAHLAALAIEHGLELRSSDRDFDRFAGLKWRNPLA